MFSPPLGRSRRRPRPSRGDRSELGCWPRDCADRRSSRRRPSTITCRDPAKARTRGEAARGLEARPDRGFSGQSGRSCLTASRAPGSTCRAPQLLRQRHVLGRGTAVVAPGLEHARQLLEARLGEEHGAALVAELALAHDRVPVAVGSERDHRIVDVQRSEALEPDDAVELVEHLVERSARCGRRSPMRTGDTSRGRPRGACRRRRRRAASASSSNERPSVPPAPAVSSSSSVQLSVSASASLITLPARLIALGTSPVLGRARVQDDADCADTGSPTRSDWVSEASDFSRISGSVGGAVEQVHRVDQHGLDRAVVNRLAELREVVLGVSGRAPHARRLVEDLDRLAASLDAALDRAVETTSIRHVCAD